MPYDDMLNILANNSGTTISFPMEQSVSGGNGEARVSHSETVALTTQAYHVPKQ
jgi:hypothetical protein